MLRVEQGLFLDTPLWHIPPDAWEFAEMPMLTITAGSAKIRKKVLNGGGVNPGHVHRRRRVDVLHQRRHALNTLCCR